MSECTECGGLVPPRPTTRGGAQNKTCGPPCFATRNARLKHERIKAKDRVSYCYDCQQPVEFEFGRRAARRCPPCAAKRRRDLGRDRQARRRSEPDWTTPKPVAHNRFESRLRSVYGITVADYEAMRTAQDGRCAICQNPPEGRGKGNVLVVDHCHSGGHVRQLLCGNCNIAIGLMTDDPAILDRAASYLRRWS